MDESKLNSDYIDEFNATYIVSKTKLSTNNFKYTNEKLR